MAKKNLGRFLALTAISTAIAAGVSYFFKYRSFHAELDEDFHDFEGDDDDFDGTLPHEREAAKRNYVPLGEKKDAGSVDDAAQEEKEEAKTAGDAAAGTDAAAAADHTVESGVKPMEPAVSTTIEEDTTVE